MLFKKQIQANKNGHHSGEYHNGIKLKSDLLLKKGVYLFKGFYAKVRDVNG